jgi:hypothetical protein
MHIRHIMNPEHLDYSYQSLGAAPQNQRSQQNCAPWLDRLK